MGEVRISERYNQNCRITQPCKKNNLSKSYLIEYQLIFSTEFNNKEIGIYTYKKYYKVED